MGSHRCAQRSFNLQPFNCNFSLDLCCTIKSTRDINLKHLLKYLNGIREWEPCKSSFIMSFYKLFTLESTAENMFSWNKLRLATNCKIVCESKLQSHDKANSWIILWDSFFAQQEEKPWKKVKRFSSPLAESTHKMVMEPRR